MRVRLHAFALAASIVLSPLAPLPSDAQTAEGVESNIALGDKQFIKLSELVLIRGRFISDLDQFPNNTYTISCLTHQCIIASVRQIGENQIGSIDISYFDVTEWSNKLIVAQDTELCMRSTLTIDRNAQTTLFFDVPMNQGIDACRLFHPTKARTATIGSPFLASRPRKP